ncbi:MAG: KUP/HAK/KT family potassium transporter [Bacteroidota bacterium]|nr:KUP/HAK/KT family potassium transporter [Bacteroidota bacterium]
MKKAHHLQRLSGAGLLITIGIIFGDIGTSPLYVLRAIVGSHEISADLVLGAVSCIFWTLTLQTSIKYVIITLQADNRGEGGTFSLYALLRRYKSRFLTIAAMIGGSALLADGMITPPISISSAIEGLHTLNDQIPVIPIVIVIISLLFFIQQFGTGFVGRSFGPIMVVWFSMIGVLGTVSLIMYPDILYAVNPVHAIELLTLYPGGFWLLGGVFLCTTGAEALYSDLGHCGKKNIRVSWIFVKTSLLLNYFGQGAWLISEAGNSLGERNPFYEIMPSWFVLTGVIISTFAAIVASQAMISGSFTLINEAIRLNFMTRFRIVYPTDIRGQIYIPAINWFLMFGCIGVVLYFRESANMEAAYGMAIILTMMATTILLVWYLKMKHVAIWLIVIFIIVYGTIESAFLVANISKLAHGGWITLLISAVVFIFMYSWKEGRRIRNRYVEFTDLREYLSQISELRKDTSIPKTSTHLVYLSSANNEYEIENTIIYSIFQKRPKRADVYWLLHVDVSDDPYRMEYKVNHLVPGEIIKIEFRIGFRIEPRINLFFRQVVSEMKAKGEVDVTSRYVSLSRQHKIGDFRFVVIEKFMSYDNVIPIYEKIILSFYNLLKKTGLSDEKAFGLDTSNVLIEKVPIVINPPSDIKLTRV